jgi:hypothetical protein
MLKALMLKELRETAWIALVALVLQLAFVANCAGYAIFPIWNYRAGHDGIPFLDGNFMVPFCVVSIALAVALGLRQTSMEGRRGAWLFLLHRPASMRRVLAAKLTVGAGLYLICGLIAILTYAVWAAMPGRHASPFLWWMTADTWKAWGAITIVYFSAFAAGIRPAHWFGTRLLPLVAGGILVMLPIGLLVTWPSLGVVVFLLVAAFLVGLIHFIARTRDFS